MMNYYVRSSQGAKFDDNDLNSFRGLAYEGQTQTQTWLGYLP